MLNCTKYYLKIANFIIEIKLMPTEKPLEYLIIKKYLNKYYNGYFFSSKTRRLKPNFIIDFMDNNNPYFIFNTKKKNKYIELYRFVSKNRIFTYYHISLSQFNLILMDVLQRLFCKNDYFLLHGSASLILNKAYIFLGKSGSGKSTMVKLINEEYPALSDDSLIIRKINKNYYFYQPPFIEKEWWIKKTHNKYLLGGVFFLNKSSFLKVNRYMKKDLILKRMIGQFYFKWMNKNYLEKQFKNIEEFSFNFSRFYLLNFTKNKDGLIQLFEKYF